MMEVLGTIGSLAVVLLLIVLAVLAISVVALVVLGCLAGSMATDWRGLWRRLARLARRGPRLTLKRSGDAVPARLRAELSGSTSGTRRRFLLGAARSGGHGHPRGPRIRGHRPVDRHTRL
ncbi:hypothetical protein ACIHFD_21425 [Nonomuraea sp. NPDC051941]|uniref:hypothetical protein n=1 Tax=Nonomuraea sp. NPDC051941 TaxID=3364373 RepID=UPI0037C57A4F